MSAYRARVSPAQLEELISGLEDARRVEYPGEEYRIEVRVYLDDYGQPAYPGCELTVTTGHVEKSPTRLDLERVR